MGIQPRKGRPPVKVDEGAMRLLFGVPQPLAAKELGISLTALKQICRKLGVVRWPYQRIGSLPAPTARQLQEPSMQEAVDVDSEGEGEGEALARSSSASSCVSCADQSPSPSSGLQEDDACLTMTSFDFPSRYSSSQSVSSFSSSTVGDADDFESDLRFFADIDKAMQSGGGWAEHHAREATIELDH